MPMTSSVCDDQRQLQAHVGIGGEKTRDRADTETACLNVAEDADDGGSTARQHREDHDFAANQGKRADTQAHIGDDAYCLRLVFDDGVRDRGQTLGVENGLLSEAIPSAGPTPRAARQPRISGSDHRPDIAGHVANVVVAVMTLMMMFAIRRAMNVYTTVSLTALPTPCGPPPAVSPL
jgi:hypothetical protein